MKKLLGQCDMRWKNTILFAVLVGIYTGVVMLLPVFKGTSMQDIGIDYTWWIIFAVIIVINCKTGIEAMLKCFVFFLISQPLVYAVEICFGTLTAERAWLYYRQMWLPMTFLTLPGGWIAYYIRKQNIIGCMVAGIGNAMEFIMAVYYVEAMTRDFPWHIGSFLVCLFGVGMISFGIQKKRKYQILSIVIGGVLTAAVYLLVR